MIVSQGILFTMRKVSKKGFEKIKTHILRSVASFQNWRRL
jgi:hypothetical protein